MLPFTLLLFLCLPLILFVSSSSTIFETFANGHLVIPKNTTVEFPHTAVLTFASITIFGTLRCHSSPPVGAFLHVTTERVLIDGGVLECQHTSAGGGGGYKGRLRMVVSGTNVVNGLIVSGILVRNSGRLLLRGTPRTSWSLLKSSLPRNARTVYVDASTGWRTGDEVVIVGTDFNVAYQPFRIVKHEKVRRKGGSVLELTLNSTSNAFVSGFEQRYASKRLQTRSEIILLSRSIQVFGVPGRYFSRNQGVSVSLFDWGSMVLENVEMRWTGLFDTVGGYPIHIHNLRERGRDVVVRNVSVFQSKNRCVSVHCTDHVVVEGMTCVDHIGHGFFLEDGSERNNTFIRNVGVATREGTGNLIPSDKSNGREGPATFWTANPDNVFFGNVAAGSFFFGFSLELIDQTHEFQKRTSICPDRLVPLQEARQIPWRKFDRNRAHSTKSSAFWIGDGYSPRQPAEMTNLQAYKIDQVGNFASCIWSHGWNIRVRDMVCADFVRALWLVFETTVLDSVFIAMSNNTGNPTQPHEVLAGRSLPSYRRISAHNVYDGPSSLDNIKFINFFDIPQSDLYSFHLDVFGGSFSSSKNAMSRIRLVNPSSLKINPIPSSGIPRLLDRDGSLSGSPNGTLMNALQVFWNPSTQLPFQLRSLDPLTNDGSCRFWLDSMVRCGPGSESALVDLSQPNSRARVPGLTAFIDGTVTSRILVPRENPLNTYEFYVRPNVKYRLSMESVRECMWVRILGGRMNDMYRFVFQTTRQTQNNARVQLYGGGGQVTKVNSVGEVNSARDDVYYFDNGAKVLHVALKISRPLTLVSRSGASLGYGDTRIFSVCLQ